MDIETAAREFIDLYPALYLRFYRRVDPREHRPRPETLALLEHLASTGPLTVAEAARHLGRSQSATSELLTRAIERELLARIPDDRDRRRHLVWLTPAGRATLERERRVLSRRLVSRAMERMTAADREDLLRGVRALVAAATPAAATRARTKRS